MAVAPHLAKESTTDSIAMFSGMEGVPGMFYDQDAMVYRRQVPPRNMATVHSDLTGKIEEIDMKIRSIERDFYGNMAGQVFVKRMAAMIKPIQDVTDVMAISSRRDMENILMAAKDKLVETKLDDSVNRLESYSKKLNFYVPKGLKIMQEVYALTRETERYCQSFYDAETMVELGTAGDYEEIRKMFYQQISENLKRIKMMWHRYDNVSGLDLTSFSQSTASMALECECTREMFLLMFPEVRGTIIESLEKLTEWIKEDKSYTSYLEGDRLYLRETIQLMNADLQSLKAKFHNTVSTIEVINEQLEDAQRNFGSGQDAEDQALRGKLREMTTHMHAIGLDRQGIRRRMKERPEISDCKENRERVEHLSGVIINDEHVIRKIKNDIKRVDQKMLVATEYNDKKTMLEQKKAAFTKTKIQLENQIKKVSDKHAKMTDQINLVEAISRIKNVPNAAYNIYYNLARKPTDQDPVIVACGVVSKHIRHKWPVLYRSLPFRGRGKEEIDNDVKDLSDRSRITTADRATRSLQRWRRYNTKASIGDIKKALNRIQEPKLWTKVQRVTKLDENFYEEEELEDAYAHVPEALRSYYIKIERFDDMNRRQAEEQARLRQREELLKKYAAGNGNEKDNNNPATTSVAH